MADASKRILLDQLPKLLRGYGKTFANYADDYPAAVILVCDLDDRCLKTFRQELYAILNSCMPKPRTGFCMAMKKEKRGFLVISRQLNRLIQKQMMPFWAAYVNDSICGTWEMPLPTRSFRVDRKLCPPTVGKRSAWKNRLGPKESPPLWMLTTTHLPVLSISGTKFANSPERRINESSRKQKTSFNRQAS